MSLARKWDLELPIPGYANQRKIIQYQLNTLNTIPPLPGLKFFCPYSDSSSTYGEAYPDSIENYTTGYAKEIAYLNHEMKSVIITILEDSQEQPIIILQGDHGPGNYFTLLGLNTEPCLEERFSILNAYYFPDQDNEHVYPTITPVNSFRVVFNNYFSANLPLQEDRSFYTS